jgi:hypothetical protein
VVRADHRYIRNAMSYDRHQGNARLRGEWRQERIREAAAKRELIAEARRGSVDEPKQRSGLARLLSRLRRTGREQQHPTP